MKIRCAGVQNYSVVNGPGLRSVVWTQGCPIQCNGCFNRDLWSFDSGFLIPPQDLADQILANDKVEGVTFSGGEPFCQAASLAFLSGILREAGLTTVTFSGFPYDTIRRKGRRSWDALLGATDLLIAGPYLSYLGCKDTLRSSKNQEFVHLSGRLAGREHECLPGEGLVEYTLHPGGEVTITGFPDHDTLVPQGG